LNLSSSNIEAITDENPPESKSFGFPRESERPEKREHIVKIEIISPIWAQTDFQIRPFPCPAVVDADERSDACLPKLGDLQRRI